MLKLIESTLEGLSEDVAEHYRKVGEEYVLDVSGIVTPEERDRIKGALDKEKNDHKASKAKLQAFSGLDAEQVHKDLDEIAELRLAATDGGDNKEELEKLVTARAHALLAPVERNLTQSQEENSTLKKENVDWVNKDRARTISSQLQKAAVKAEVVPSALDDIGLYADAMFTIAEHDGSVITREGLVGVSPGLSPELFFIEMKETRPHWYKPSQGVGAKGSGAGGGGGANPWSKDHYNLTEQGKILREDRSKAEKMAAAAGETLPTLG